MSLKYEPLTIGGVAYILNVDRTTVENWVKKGYLKCLRACRNGRYSKISWTALLKFMKNYPELWNAAKMRINPFDYQIKVPWFERKLKKDKEKARENLTWTDWEDKILIEEYNEDPQKCYKLIKRSDIAIRIRAHRLRKAVKIGVIL